MTPLEHTSRPRLSQRELVQASLLRCPVRPSDTLTPSERLWRR